MERLIIFGDIETDRVQAWKLLQIAAVSSSGDTFCIYINPQTTLPLECTSFSGFYYYKEHLYRNGIRLPSVNIKRGLVLFKNWLESFCKPITLVFHNGLSKEGLSPLIMRVHNRGMWPGNRPGSLVLQNKDLGLANHELT